MALSLRGSAENAATAGADVTVTHPGGIAEDDVVYFGLGIATINDQDLSMSTSGYTELVDLFSNDSEDANLGVFRKFMTASPDSVAVGNGTGDGSDSTIAVEHVWTGADTTTPEDATTTTATGIDGTDPDSPSITTVTDNAIVLTIAHHTHDDPTPTSPSGYGNVLDTVGANFYNGAIYIGSKSVSPAGAENPAAWALIGGSAIDSWAAVSVAIRPAGVGARLFGHPFYGPLGGPI